jgi:hypothetical protein
VPLYRVPPAAVYCAAAGQPPAAACRCCPGGPSRSTRSRRYPSDMDDREWAVCEPLLPHPAWLAGKGGRPSGYCMRDIVDGIRYLTHHGPRRRPGNRPVRLYLGPPGGRYGPWRGAASDADGE